MQEEVLPVLRALISAGKATIGSLQAVGQALHLMVHQAFRAQIALQASALGFGPCVYVNRLRQRCKHACEVGLKLANTDQTNSHKQP